MPQVRVPELSLRDQLLGAARQRYRVARSRREKGQILDEFVARTGYHRKHALRLMRPQTGGPPDRRVYDDRVREAVIIAWETAGRPGSRRLKRLLPDLVNDLERRSLMPRDVVLRGKLLAASHATLDRLLAPVRSRSVAEALEERLQSISSELTKLALSTIPADASPEERARLTAQLTERGALGHIVHEDSAETPATDPRES